MRLCGYCGFEQGGTLCGAANPEACANAYDKPERDMRDVYGLRDLNDKDIDMLVKAALLVAFGSK